MSTERRVFRPFDVPAPIATFLGSARLMIREDTQDLVEPFSRRQVDPSDIHAGVFDLVLAEDDEAFSELAGAACEVAREHYGSGAVELIIVVSSAYLKIAEIPLQQELNEVGRVVRVRGEHVPRAFQAGHHGCDIDAYLVLAHKLDERPLRPWRKATWLSRARFELRTGLEGVGFNILPLTEALREEHGLSEQTLRYVAIELSPLEAPASSTVNLYLDSELLARLKREPRKNWAKAFTDQLAVDVLAAIAVRALADEALTTAEWSSIEDTMLGALITMIGGRPPADETARRDMYQKLLEDLRSRPQRFLALIDGAIEMRNSSKLLIASA